MATSFATVDEYIASFPSAVQHVLQEIRRTMHTVVPGAGETISYNIPTITLGGGPLVYFAGWKRHVSVYPIPDGDDAYEIVAERGDAGVGDAARDEPVVPAEV